MIVVRLPPATAYNIIMASMFEFRTTGYNGYAVKYSSYHMDQIAVATAANFGLVGNGRLYILRLTGAGIVSLRQ
jgi:peroxin-7